MKKFLLTLCVLLCCMGASRAQVEYPDVPLDDPAYADLITLVGEDKTFYCCFSTPCPSKPRTMTRYEFTVAIARYISPSGKSNVLEHQLFITTLQADALQRLIQKFEPELQALGVPHLKVERRMVWNTLRVPSTWQTEIFIRPQVIAPAFKDISKNHWAFAAVESLRQSGIVIGYPSLSSSGARETFQ